MIVSPPEQNFSKKTCLVKTQVIFLIIGILIGFFGILGWNYILPKHLILDASTSSNYLYHDIDLEMVRNETNDRLVKYIEGKWRSSAGDILIWIKNADEQGDILVMELKTPESKKEIHFKIIDFVKIDGFFGIIKLNICEINSNCSINDIVPIQINRVFNVDKTIVISYPSTWTGCIEEDADGICSRSFKLMH
jgi:hypothetical protein